MMKDVVAPGCSNYRRGGKRDRREGRWGYAEETEAAVFVGRRRN